LLKQLKKINYRTKNYYLPIVIVVIIFTSLVFYMLFTSDSRFTGNDNIVTLHFADNITKAHAKTIERFNEKYAGRIKVVAVDLPFEKFSTNERKELLARSMRSKSDKLDVFSVDHIWVRRFARWTVPLDELYDQQEIDNFIPNALEPCYVDGVLHAAPLYLDVGLMYYRSDLFEAKVHDKGVEKRLENSITWEEFIQLSKKFDNPFYLFPADSYEGLVCSYLEMVLNLNRSFFDTDSLDFTRPEAVKALNFLVDLVNRFKLSPKEVTSFKENHARDYFIANDGIFLRGWPGFVIDFNNYNLSKERINDIKQLPLPHFAGTIPAYIFGGWNLMISKYSNHKKEAMIFLKYLTSEESQLIMFQFGKHNPVRKDIYTNDEIIKKYPVMKYFETLFKLGVHRPFLNDYTRVSDIISLYINKAIKGDLTPERALHEANKMIWEGRVVIR